MAGLGLPPVHWTIGGQPVTLADWSANASADAGFDQMRGAIASSDARIMPESIMQGSIISGWSEYGRVVFEGRLSAAPKIDQGGTATVVAQGRVSEARKRQSRMLLYTDKTTVFIDPQFPPINRTYAILAVGAGVTFADADPAGAVDDARRSHIYYNASAPGGSVLTMSAQLSIPEGRIFRVSGRVEGSSSADNLLIQGSDTISGPAVTYGEALGGTAYSFNVIIPDGTPNLILTHVAGSVLTQFVVLDVQVWGEQSRTVVYSELAAAAIAHRLGWDPSGVQAAGGVDVRPVDWFGPWDELIAYLASFDDICWGVYEDERGYGPRLDFGPYGRRHWQVSSAGATWDLQPLEIFNRVIVAYVSDQGRDAQLALDADPDPLAAVGLTNDKKLSMNDRQSGFDLAARYGSSTLAHASLQLYAGRISLVSAMDTASGVDAPYEIRAGDLITIADFNATQALTVRVSDVEYAPNIVTVGVEEAAVPAAQSGAGIGTVVPPAPFLPPAAPVAARTSQPSQSVYQGGAQGLSHWLRWRR